MTLERLVVTREGVEVISKRSRRSANDPVKTKQGGRKRSRRKQIVRVASGSGKINQSRAQCSFSGILVGLFFRWCSVESTRLSPMWPGFDSKTQRYMWADFVVGSRHYSEGFSLSTPVSTL